MARRVGDGGRVSPSAYRRYRYVGDARTDPSLRGIECTTVVAAKTWGFRPTMNISRVRGADGSVLVLFTDGRRAVVPERHLIRIHTDTERLEAVKRRVAIDQRSAGVIDPFPRALCPRCGHWVALIRSMTRTQVHRCYYNDDLGDVSAAVDMKTGETTKVQR